MEINREELLKALNQAAPGLSSLELTENSNCFIFDKKHIITYNDEVSVSIPFEHTLIKKAIGAKELLDILKKIKSKTIIMEMNAEEILIKAKNIKTGLKIQYDVHVPVDIKKKDNDLFYTMPENFIEGLSFSKLAIGTDLQEVFGYAHISEDIIQSCSNYSAIRFKLSSPVQHELFIPHTVIDKIVNGGYTEFHKHDGWIHFLNTDTQAIFSTRTIESEYPDLLPFFLEKGTKIQIPDNLTDSLTRSSVFSENTDMYFANLTYKKGKCFLSAKNEKGWIKEKIKIKSDSDFDFYFGVEQLRKVISKSKSAKLTKGTIRFRVGSGQYLVKLKGE